LTDNFILTQQYIFGVKVIFADIYMKIRFIFQINFRSLVILI